MKCDELEEEYLWTNNVKTPSTIMVRVYNADEVDAAIAELKARIQLDDDEMAGFLDLEEECGGGDLRNYIAELKAKLEDVQASHYAEMVDAGMRERREVSSRLAKLNKAIEADPEAVSEHHKELWRKQAKAMQEYVDVLGERIKDLIDNG